MDVKMKIKNIHFQLFCHIDDKITFILLLLMMVLMAYDDICFFVICICLFTYIVNTMAAGLTCPGRRT